MFGVTAASARRPVVRAYGRRVTDGGAAGALQVLPRDRPRSPINVSSGDDDVSIMYAAYSPPGERVIVTIYVPNTTILCSIFIELRNRTHGNGTKNRQTYVVNHRPYTRSPQTRAAVGRKRSFFFTAPKRADSVKSTKTRTVTVPELISKRLRFECTRPLRDRCRTFYTCTDSIAYVVARGIVALNRAICESRRSNKI